MSIKGLEYPFVAVDPTKETLRNNTILGGGDANFISKSHGVYGADSFKVTASSGLNVEISPGVGFFVSKFIYMLLAETKLLPANSTVIVCVKYDPNQTNTYTGSIAEGTYQEVNNQLSLTYILESEYTEPTYSLMDPDYANVIKYLPLATVVTGPTSIASVTEYDGSYAELNPTLATSIMNYIESSSLLKMDKGLDTEIALAAGDDGYGNIGANLWKSGKSACWDGEKLFVDGMEVIEHGSNANGEWLRFANGVLMTFRYLSFTTAITTAVGSMYKSAEVLMGNFPWTFVGTPMVMVTPTDGAYGVDYWLGPVKYSTSSDAGAIVLLAPTSIASRAFAVAIVAYGRWK